MNTSLSLKHIAHVAFFIIHSMIFLKLTGFMDKNQSADLNYGSVEAYILYSLKILTFIGVPISILNAAGVLIFDIFPITDRISRRSAPLLEPFISFRVVTRGSFPDLVRHNVERNLRVCEDFGLDKFVIEVVTDTPILLPKNPKVREIVVPSNYRTSTGAKFKARALQYALEPDVNILNDDDWIVHLDEETIMTTSSLTGIFNFLHENK